MEEQKKDKNSEILEELKKIRERADQCYFVVKLSGC